jgi:superfamily I DNA/RNA helicase
MAKYAQHIIGNVPEDSYIGTFNHLLGIDFTSKIDLSEASKNFLKNNIAVNQYDILIVDEAQDLMDLNILEAISLFIKGGIEKGNWVFLYDPNQNIFKSSCDFNETIEYLKKGCGAFSYKLNTNCRNTKQIASKVAAITKTGAAHIMNLSGQDVVIEPYDNDKELISKLKYRIQSLITGGIRAHNIVILSKYKLENSGLKNIRSICNYDIKEMHDLPETNRNSIKYYTVQSFKGLEADVVFYIDIDGFSDIKTRMLNYVGLSRAKSLLFAFYKENAKEDFYNFILTN